MERQNNRDKERERKPADDFVEKLVKLNRTSVTKKGGRKMAFSALTVVGDQKGKIGFGYGKANDVSEAIRKSIEKAKANLVTIPMKNGTIPHEVIGKFNSSEVLLKPACPGTGVKAGGAVRAVMDAAGITDVISKAQGSRTSVNVIRATFDAVSKMMDAGKVSNNRGRSLNDLWG